MKLYDGNATSPRHMSEKLYKSSMWRTLRRQLIKRDFTFDLGAFGIYIDGTIILHHITPINEYDIRYMTTKVTDPENLIICSIETHNSIHYTREEPDPYVERFPGDTIFW